MNPVGEHEDQPSAEGSRPEQRILSMTQHATTPSSTEAVLRKHIDELGQAIRDKNVDHLMTFYAPDVVVFDVRPPLDTCGTGEIRKNFERWFASFEGPIGFEFNHLRIVSGEGAAFCHYLALVTGARPGGCFSGYWVRGTTCFEQREDRWLVTHEHISMPAPITRTG
jgi:ketosteroid isomerase-like protein